MKKGSKHSKKTINKIKLARSKQVNPNWKGGKIYRDGYVYIKLHEHPLSGKQGYYAEHRLVIEKHLKRYLTKQEVVHHINGVKDDNRLSNLCLYKTKGEHTKLAHKEVYENNRINNLGIRRSIKTEFKKGQTSWNKGIPMSKEAKEKLIATLASKKQPLF